MTDRQGKECPGKCRECGHDSCHDAKTAEISKLQARVERLTKENAELEALLPGESIFATLEIKSLTDTVRRYRGALEKIASMKDLTFAECSDAEMIVNTAKEALNEG